jgi:hypothetical protein
VHRDANPVHFGCKFYDLQANPYRPTSREQCLAGLFHDLLGFRRRQDLQRRIDDAGNVERIINVKPTPRGDADQAGESLLPDLEARGVPLGPFADRVNQRMTACGVLLLAAAALSVLAWRRDPVVIVLANAVFGLTVGNVTTLSAIIVRREFGPASFSIFGMASCGIQLVAALGPSFCGILHDAFGSYSPSLLLAAVLDITAAASIMHADGSKSRQCLQPAPDMDRSTTARTLDGRLGAAASGACVRSAITSSASSIPTDTRSRSSVMPYRIRCAASTTQWSCLRITAECQ